MSRVSLSRRLAAILDTAERIDPMAVAVHRLPPAFRDQERPLLTPIEEAHAAGDYTPQYHEG